MYKTVNNHRYSFQPAVAGLGVDDMKMIQPEVPNIRSVYDASMRNIATGSGIPLRILQGTEEGKMAGDQDKSTFNSRMEARRHRVVGIPIRDFIDRLKEWGVLPKELGRRWQAKWDALNDTRTIENLDKSMKMVDDNDKLIRMGGTAAFSIEEIREQSGYDVADKETLQRIKEQFTGVPMPSGGSGASEQNST